MPYVYQISGVLEGTTEDMMTISRKARDRIDAIEGIHHRLLMKQDNDAVASSLYVCVDKDTALKVQKVMQELLNEHADLSPFNTEWVFEVIDSALYPKE
jgi:hypothetical protein